MRNQTLAVAALALPLLIAPQIASAQEMGTQNGLQYACTGTGLEERQDAKWQAYPLRLEATHLGGGYLSNINWKITDRAGATVFQERCEFAPWLVVGLPAGSYRITATAEGGYTRTTQVAVKSGSQRRVVLRFNEIAER